MKHTKPPAVTASYHRVRSFERLRPDYFPAYNAHRYYGTPSPHRSRALASHHPILYTPAPTHTRSLSNDHGTSTCFAKSPEASDVSGAADIEIDHPAKGKE